MLLVAESVSLGDSLEVSWLSWDAIDYHCLVLVLNHLGRHTVVEVVLVIALDWVLLNHFALVVCILLLELVVLSIKLGLRVGTCLAEYLRVGLLKFGEHLHSMLGP